MSLSAQNPVARPFGSPSNLRFSRKGSPTPPARTKKYRHEPGNPNKTNDIPQKHTPKNAPESPLNTPEKPAIHPKKPIVHCPSRPRPSQQTVAFFTPQTQ